MSAAEIHALIRLLTDPNPGIRDAVERRLGDFGSDAVPYLAQAGEAEDPHLRVRARAVAHVIQRTLLERRLSALLSRDEPDLAEACLLLAQAEDPMVSAEALGRELDRLTDRLRRSIATRRSAESRASALGEVLGKREGFHGAAEDYYDPRNSYINQVLARRQGIPISLSAIYMIVGRRAGLDLQGVGMPSHFLVRFVEGDQLFFVDPFGGGRILTRDDCRALLSGFNHSWRDEYLRTISDRDMLRRMVANLIHIYHRHQDHHRLERLYLFVNLLQGKDAR